MSGCRADGETRITLRDAEAAISVRPALDAEAQNVQILQDLRNATRYHTQILTAQKHVRRLGKGAQHFSTVIPPGRLLPVPKVIDQCSQPPAAPVDELNQSVRMVPVPGRRISIFRSQERVGLNQFLDIFCS